MLANRHNIKRMAMTRRDAVILVVVLVVAGLFYPDCSQAIELNAAVRGAAPILLSYYQAKTVYDFAALMDPSDTSAVVARPDRADKNHRSGATDPRFMTDEQTLVVNLFEIELEPEKRKKHTVTFGLSAVSYDYAGAADPADQSLSAVFINTAPFSDGKPSGIFERIKDTLLLFHFTIRY